MVIHGATRAMSRGTRVLLTPSAPALAVFVFVTGARAVAFTAFYSNKTSVIHEIHLRYDRPG
jgi:hypothetical protein